MLSSLPPVGTRPGILDERRRLLEVAAEMGLEPENLMEAALPYLSPPFERVALLASRVRRFSADWRKGDLLTLKRVQARLSTRRDADCSASVWEEQRIGAVRIRTRPLLDGLTRGRGVLDSLVADDVLVSVSRRAEVRSQINVWTSCNRVFNSGDVGVVRAALKILAGKDYARSPDGMNNDSIHRLRAIVDIEANEVSVYR